jgi:hypothetical protein
MARIDAKLDLATVMDLMTVRDGPEADHPHRTVSEFVSATLSDPAVASTVARAGP